MKSITLLLLRVSTGLLLIVWGMLRAFNPERGVGLAERHYSGILAAETPQLILGYGEIIIGILIILGLFRILVYPLQAIILGAGAFLIWPHFVEPFIAPLGISLFDDPKDFRLLFFPSLIVFFATLIPLAFKEYDTLSLDSMFRR